MSEPCWRSQQICILFFFQVINICTWMGQEEYELLTVTVLLPWIQSTRYRNSEERVLFCSLWGNRLDYLEKLPRTDISRNINSTSESYWIHQYFVLLTYLCFLLWRLKLWQRLAYWKEGSWVFTLALLMNKKSYIMFSIWILWWHEFGESGFEQM